MILYRYRPKIITLRLYNSAVPSITLEITHFKQVGASAFDTQFALKKGKENGTAARPQ
jgi:hypothetical protein